MQEKMMDRRHIRRTEFLRRAKKDLGITASAEDQRADGLADQIQKFEDWKKAADKVAEEYVSESIDRHYRLKRRHERS